MLKEYYLKKFAIFIIVTVSSLQFSSGLSTRVDNLESDLFQGKKKTGQANGTLPGFLLQGTILLLTFHHFGDNNPVIKNIKIILQIFALSGYAFALGATNLSIRNGPTKFL